MRARDLIMTMGLAILPILFGATSVAAQDGKRGNSGSQSGGVPISKELLDLERVTRSGGAISGDRAQTSNLPVDRWTFSYRNEYPGAYVNARLPRGGEIAVAVMCVPKPGPDTTYKGIIYVQTSGSTSSISRAFDGASVYSVKNNQQTSSFKIGNEIDRIGYHNIEAWRAADRFVLVGSNGAQAALSASGSSAALKRVVDECGYDPIRGFDVRPSDTWTWDRDMKSTQIAFSLRAEIRGFVEVACSGGGKYILNYGYGGIEYPLQGQQKEIVDAFFSSDPTIKLIKDGRQIGYLMPTGPHGDVLDERHVAAMRDSDYLIVEGGPTSFRLPVQQAAQSPDTVFRWVREACR